MHEIGYVLTESKPEYVVLGETRNLSFGQLDQGCQIHKRRLEVHRYQPGCHWTKQRWRDASNRLGRRPSN